MNIKQWDVYADLYNKGVGPEGDNLHKTLLDPIIFDFLEDWRGLTILDAGCGNGYLLNKLSSKAKKVIGLDSSKKLLKHAAVLVKVKNVNLKYGDLTKELSFKNKSFDVVILNMTAQYLPSLIKFSSEAVRILKPKGKLIVTIAHPGHVLFARAQELIGKKSDKFLTSANYFKVGKRKKSSLWKKAILYYYHRPLSFYFNSFTFNFCLKRVVEKTADGEIPRIFGFLWVKR